MVGRRLVVGGMIAGGTSVAGAVVVGHHMAKKAISTYGKTLSPIVIDKSRPSPGCSGCTNTNISNNHSDASDLRGILFMKFSK